MRATKRRFNANLQKIRILHEGAPRREYVCTRCIKAGKVTKHARGIRPGAASTEG
jgi:large subunit ribosomal protein L28